MEGMNISITAGANQAFVDAAMAVCDEGDNAIILAPYFFSHRMTLQMCNANISICPFDTKTLAPDFEELKRLVSELKPKLVVMTSPNNPSGYVFSAEQVRCVVELCRSVGAWLVADQTYHEFLYDGADHVFPCGSAQAFAYDRILHIFSFSKIFGMPGWRVGYIVFPECLTQHIRKIQDAVPTHAAILSQHLALACLQDYYPRGSGIKKVRVDPTSSREGYSSWAMDTVGTLEVARSALWPALQSVGTVRTNGSFYFLVPVPSGVEEEEAVHMLATQYGVLLMPGSAFGAPQHMRLSYGNVHPDKLSTAVDKIQRGLQRLLELSSERS